MTNKTIYKTALVSKGNFTTISNKLLQDSRLSHQTKGLLCEILSRPDDWEITIQGIIAMGTSGRDKVYRMVKEAKKFGYCCRQELRNINGTIKKQTYVVSDDPDYLENQYKKIANCLSNSNLLSDNLEVDTSAENPPLSGYPDMDFQEVGKVAENKQLGDYPLPENKEVGRMAENLPLRDNTLPAYPHPENPLPEKRQQQKKDNNK